MPFLLIDGFQMYYETHGQGEAIVLAHGRGGSHLSWWQQVPVLSRQYQVITFDHRGFGQSPDTPDGPGRSAYADDLGALLDHLDIQSAYLVGQSMGGWTSLGFAVNKPERVHGLILADTSAGIAEEVVLQAYRDKDEPPANVFDRAISAGFKKRDPERAFLYAQLSALNSEPAESLMSLLLSDDGPKAETLASLAIPTMFIVGEHDIVVPLEVVRLCAGFMGDATIEIVPDTGHSVYFERPGIFNDLVQNFVDRVEAERVNGVESDAAKVKK